MMGALAMAAALSLPPVEECGRDAAFAKVRAQFAEAVRERDVEALAGLASDDVALDDIGEDRGPARLREMMREERGADFWRELEPLAEGGCALREGERILPSFATKLSGEEEMIVAAAHEPIRSGSEPDSKIIGRAKWEWVEQNYADSGPFYWHVRLRSGRVGYIRSERIYSAYSPYAAFALRDGRWRMTALRLLPAD
jgi:hypothetical protein